MSTILLTKAYLDTFSAKDIGKNIQNLDSNKAHGHNSISIRMLKMCGDSICVSLEMMIFKQALLTVLFPSEWKKGNVFLIHKKRFFTSVLW